MIFGRKYGYNGLSHYRPKWAGVDLESKRWLRPDRHIPRDESRLVGMALLALVMFAMPIVAFFIGKLL